MLFGPPLVTQTAELLKKTSEDFHGFFHPTVTEISGKKYYNLILIEKSQKNSFNIGIIR